MNFYLSISFPSSSKNSMKWPSYPYFESSEPRRTANFPYFLFKLNNHSIHNMSKFSDLLHLGTDQDWLKGAKAIYNFIFQMTLSSASGSSMLKLSNETQWWSIYKIATYLNCPGRVIQSTDDIKCFSRTLNWRKWISSLNNGHYDLCSSTTNWMLRIRYEF